MSKVITAEISDALCEDGKSVLNIRFGANEHNHQIPCSDDYAQELCDHLKIFDPDQQEGGCHHDYLHHPTRPGEKCVRCGTVKGEDQIVREHSRDDVGVARGLLACMKQCLALLDDGCMDIEWTHVRKELRGEIDKAEFRLADARNDCMYPYSQCKKIKLTDAKPKHIWDDERIWDAVRFITARSGPCVNHKPGYDCFSTNIGQTTICEPCQATRVIDQLKNDMPSNAKPDDPATTYEFSQWVFEIGGRLNTLAGNLHNRLRFEDSEALRAIVYDLEQMPKRMACYKAKPDDPAVVDEEVYESIGDERVGQHLIDTGVIQKRKYNPAVVKALIDLLLDAELPESLAAKVGCLIAKLKGAKDE